MKNLKERKLYEIKYINWLGEIKITIGYLIVIDLNGDFGFSEDKDTSNDSYDKFIKQKSIIKIKELKEKGEAIELKAE